MTDFTPEQDVPSLPPAPIPEPGPVRVFFSDLVLLLTEPARFFGERFGTYSLTRALVFGIIVNWVASFFDWLTRLIKNETLMDGILRVKRQLEMLPFWNRLPETLWDQGNRAKPLFPSWLAELSGIALSPFHSLLQFAISGIALYACAWILIRRRNEGEDALEIPVFMRLAAFASTPNLIASILGFLPVGLGGFIGWIYCAALMMVGLMTRFRISGLRALVLMLLPGILGTLALACVIGGLVALVLALFAALFGAL
jgi:hypothetical protein